MIRIKMCGITNVDDALAAVECGADALGFVFANSPRKVTPDTARVIISRIPPFTTTVGVFVDEEADRVMDIAAHCKLDVLQFHGEESPEYCQRFHRKVIKAFRVKDESVVEEVKRYQVDGFLLDSGSGGGTGIPFEWDLVKQIGVPVVLAGGLDPDNVQEAIRRVQPWAVDVSSGIEREPGKKDQSKMKEFVRHVRRSER